MNQFFKDIFYIGFGGSLFGVMVFLCLVVSAMIFLLA